MADDKTKASSQDRADLQKFADAHGLPVEQVRELVERVGNSRSALEAAVQMLDC